ncbi:hypothetical protein NL676_010790 [Syzygium grande]|nr:hypothetical protein NL676_010790 [Syzygium grande]
MPLPLLHPLFWPNSSPPSTSSPPHISPASPATHPAHRRLSPSLAALELANLARRLSPHLAGQARLAAAQAVAELA